MKKIKPRSVIAKNIFLCTFLLLSSTLAYSQNHCDSLHVVSVQFHPTNSNSIALTVANSSSNIFAYPSFVLYNADGDTLAKETVNFFGIGGGSQTHFLTVHPNAFIPSGAFPATLELFAGFGDSLMCSWNILVPDLCPTTACEPAEIYVVNTGILMNLAVNWSLYDSNNQMVDGGVIWMDTISHTHFDSVCIAPGAYRLEIFGFFQPSQFVLGITDSYSSSIGTNTVQQNDSTPEDLNFEWFEACLDGTNSVNELTLQSLSTVQHGSELTITLAQNESIGAIALYNTQGQLLLRDYFSTAQGIINVAPLPSGVFILQHSNNRGAGAHKLFIH